MTADGRTRPCPVEGCAYEEIPSLVATHVQRQTDRQTDAAHDWEQLGFEGPREFLRTEPTDEADPSERDDETVVCPVDDCSYENVPESVAAHVSGTHDDDYDWDALPYSGTVDFRNRAHGLDESVVVRCPVSDCQYEGSPSSVRGHVSGRPDQEHATDRLRRSGKLPISADDIVDEVAATKRPDDDTDHAGRESTVGSEQTQNRAATDETEPSVDEQFRRAAMAVLAEKTTVDSLPDRTTQELIDSYVLFSAVAASADDIRKSVRDELLGRLDSDLELTANAGSVRRVTYTRKQLKDEAVVLSRLADVGVPAAAVHSVDPEKVEAELDGGDRALDVNDVFDVEERSTVRRQTLDEDYLRERLASVDTGDF